MAARKTKGPNGDAANAPRRRPEGGRASVASARPRESRVGARKKGVVAVAVGPKGRAAADRTRRGAPGTRAKRPPKANERAQPSTSAPLFEPKRVGSYLVAKLRALGDALGETLPRVASESDGEAIHDMRVAIRRLRTILKVARPVFGKFHADAVRQAFTQVHRATSALRDEEVLEETLEAVRIPEASFTGWQRRRKLREQRLRREVRSLLESGELDRAQALLGALLTLPVKPSRDKDLLKFARNAVDRAREVVEDEKDVALDDAPGLHALRIRFKHLRYTTEIFSEALPPALATLAKTSAQFQKRLGEIHDLDVALETVRLARGLTQGARAAVTAELEAAREQAIEKFAALRAAGGKPPRADD